MIPLTFDYSTADSAHKLLEQIVEIQCKLAQSTEYGLPIIDKLTVANSHHTEFLLQAEIKAIREGLHYREEEYKNGSKYRGYVS